MNYPASKFRAAKIVSGGRLQLPAEIRRAMGLADGDTVVMEVRDGTLHVRAYRDVIAQVQERMQKYAPQDGTLVSDELIAERRAEAARE